MQAPRVAGFDEARQLLDDIIIVLERECVANELVVRCIGYENHENIYRWHEFPCRYTVTHAAVPDETQLAGVPDPDNTSSDVGAGTACRSRENLAMLARRGLVERLCLRPARLRRPTAPPAAGHPHLVRQGPCK